MKLARKRIILVSVLVLVLPLVWVSSAGAAGPISPLYLTGIQFGPGLPNVNRIKVVQGDSVTLAWDTRATIDGLIYEESPIAVSSTIKTMNASTFPDPDFPELFPIYTATYDLTTGVFLGSSPLNAFPMLSPTLADYLYDGTTDGVHNYALGLLSGNVYSFDSNWDNFQTLFTLPPIPGPSPGTDAFWQGITYDASNNSIWVAGHNNVIIANYTLNGTLLSSFGAAAGGAAGGLALDPADHTLWLFRGFAGTFPARIDQYSKQGTFLGSTAPLELQNFGTGGAEFQFQLVIAKGDVNGDGKIDITDVQAITQARNTPATQGDRRDVDGDGRITVLDARQCALLCTNPRCAP